MTPLQQSSIAKSSRQSSLQQRSRQQIGRWCCVLLLLTQQREQHQHHHHSSSLLSSVIYVSSFDIRATTPFKSNRHIHSSRGIAPSSTPSFITPSAASSSSSSCRHKNIYRRITTTSTTLSTSDMLFDHENYEDNNNNDSSSMNSNNIENDIMNDEIISSSSTLENYKIEEQITSHPQHILVNDVASTASPSNTPTSSRFLQGDELHRLRRRVLHMKQLLYNARQQNDILQIQSLTSSILAAQELDGEYIYMISLQKQKASIQAGLYDEAAIYAKEAKLAKESLLQFQLSGLWVGKYNDNSFQLINVTYSNDILTAYKVTNSPSCTVPKGEVTFQVDLTPISTSTASSSSSTSLTSSSTHYHHPNSQQYHQYGEYNNEQHDSYNQHYQQQQQQYLEPIQLDNNDAIVQWGIQYLQRHVGYGQVAMSNYKNAQYVPGQLILINEHYFSFIWLPTQHHVFFGRPSPELILQLLRNNNQNINVDSNNDDNDTIGTSNNDNTVKNNDIRQYLERCYEETVILLEEEEDDDNDNDDETINIVNYETNNGAFE